MREAVLGLGEVRRTAFHAKMRGNPPEGPHLTACARRWLANDPAAYPGFGRQPARLLRDDVGEEDAAVLGAEQDPRRASYGTRLLVLEMDLVARVDVERHPGR